jgi:nucleotide-binding universal stress UspA family protein
MYKRILVPLDGSSLAETIVSHVKVIAKSFGREVLFLCVIPAPAPEFASPAPPMLKKLSRNQRGDTTRYLKSVCAKVEKEGAHATYLIREGGVPETILEVAEFMQADMIAMSTHGRSGAQLLLSGSVLPRFNPGKEFKRVLDAIKFNRN